MKMAQSFLTNLERLSKHNQESQIKIPGYSPGIFYFE